MWLKDEPHTETATEELHAFMKTTGETEVVEELYRALTEDSLVLEQGKRTGKES